MRPSSSSFLRGSRTSRGSSGAKGSGGRTGSISARRSSLFLPNHDSSPLFTHQTNSPPSLVYRTYDTQSLFDYYAVRGNKEIMRHPEAVNYCLEAPPPAAPAPGSPTSAASGLAPAAGSTGATTSGTAAGSAPTATNSLHCAGSVDFSAKRGLRLSHPRVSSAHRFPSSFPPSSPPPLPSSLPANSAAAVVSQMKNDRILLCLEEEKDETTDPSSFNAVSFNRLPVEVLRRNSSVIHLLEDEGGTLLVRGGGGSGPSANGGVGGESGGGNYGVINTSTLEGVEHARAAQHILPPSGMSAGKGMGPSGSLMPNSNNIIVANPHAVFTSTFRPFSTSIAPPFPASSQAGGVGGNTGGSPAAFPRRQGSGGGHDVDKVGGGAHGAAVPIGGGKSFAKGGKIRKSAEEEDHPHQAEEGGAGGEEEGGGSDAFSLNHPLRCDHSLYQQCLLAERSFKVPSLPPVEAPLAPRLHGPVSKEKSGILAMYDHVMQEQKKRHRTLSRAAQATLPPAELYYQALYWPTSAAVTEEGIRQHLQQKLWEAELMDATLMEQYALHLHHQPPSSTSSKKGGPMNLVNGSHITNSSMMPAQSMGALLSSVGAGGPTVSGGRASLSGGGSLSSSRRNAPGSMPPAGGGGAGSFINQGTSPHFHSSSVARGGGAGGWVRSSPGSMASSYAGVPPGDSVLHYGSLSSPGALRGGPTSPRSMVAPSRGQRHAGASFSSCGVFPILPGSTRYMDITQYAHASRVVRTQVLENLLDAFVGGYYVMNPDAKAKQEAAEEAESKRRASIAAAELLRDSEREGEKGRRSDSTSRRPSLLRATEVKNGSKKKKKKNNPSVDRQERNPREGEPLPNLRLFQNALLSVADSQGLLTLSQFQKALQDVPFEVTNTEALRLFFMWVRETSGAPLTYRPSPLPPQQPGGGGGEDLSGGYPQGGSGSVGIPPIYSYLTRHTTANIEPLNFTPSGRSGGAGGGGAFTMESSAVSLSNTKRHPHGSTTGGGGAGGVLSPVPPGGLPTSVAGHLPNANNISSPNSSPGSISTTTSAGASGAAAIPNTPNSGGDVLSRTARDGALGGGAGGQPMGLLGCMSGTVIGVPGNPALPALAGGPPAIGGFPFTMIPQSAGPTNNTGSQRRRSTSVHARRASSVCPSKVESPPQRAGYAGAPPSSASSLPMPYLPSTAVVYVHELLAGLDELLNGALTKDIVRWMCFQLFAKEGQGYIHKSILQNLRHTREGEADGANANITGSVIKSLLDCFDNVAKEEEEAFIKASGKGKKRRKAAPALPSHQKSIIPLHVMRKVHISFSEFTNFFTSLPQLPASFVHYWLPLLVYTPSAPYLLTPHMALIGVFNGAAMGRGSSFCGGQSDGAGEKRMSVVPSNAFNAMQRRGRGNSMTTFKDGHANTSLSHRRPSEGVLLNSGGAGGGGGEEDGTPPLTVHGGGEVPDNVGGSSIAGTQSGGSISVLHNTSPRDRASSVMTTGGSGTGGPGVFSGVGDDSLNATGIGLSTSPPSLPPRPPSIEMGTYPLELLGLEEPSRTLLVHQMIVHRVDAVRSGFILMRQSIVSSSGQSFSKGRSNQNDDGIVKEKTEDSA